MLRHAWPHGESDTRMKKPMNYVRVNNSLCLLTNVSHALDLSQTNRVGTFDAFELFFKLSVPH